MLHFSKHLLLLGIFFCALTSSATDLRGDTVSIKTIQLHINLTDFASKNLIGEAVIGIKAKQNAVSGIHLDLLKLAVDSVKVNAQQAAFSYNDTTIHIPFFTALNQNDSATVQVFYHGTPLQEVGDFGGFYWTTSQAFNIGVSFLADPHNYGRVWFPCFDNFRERSLYEFYITTKDIHKAFCNGLLQGVTTAGNTKIWHWKLGQDIPSYLASVAVTTYQTLLDTVQGIGGTKEIQIAARTTDTTAVKTKFVNLRSAYHIFEEAWGEYKWDRVGYCIVPFNAGAMEHATNIGFMQALLFTNFEDCEDVMVHELAHHWFGDLVTCDSASEMWLNEGWAVYNEHLFHEKFYGVEDYKRKVRDNHEKVLHRTHLDDGAYFPVSGLSTEQTYGSTVNDKGGDFVHTLRTYMGDAAFFSCMRSYLNDYSFKNSSTAQLRDYLSSCLGSSLNDYFNDWIYSEGFAHFAIEKITHSTHQVGGNSFNDYFVDIRQRLHQAPHYYNNVPVTLSYYDDAGLITQQTVTVSGECTQAPPPDVFGHVVTYIALDFDEKLQDAITDEWKIINDTGSYDFGTAKMIVHADSYLSPTGILRVMHNWIAPEPMTTKIPGLHLHDKRYWTVEGNASVGTGWYAIINYDGNDASLDNPFISNSEDSLVLLYRPDANTEWEIADSFVVNTGTSTINKTGSVTIYNLAKGQYCLGIWNSAVPDNSIAEADCIFSGTEETVSRAAFEMFPNPANNLVNLSFERSVFTQAVLTDITGRKIWEQRISPLQSSMEVKLQALAPAVYILTLNDNHGQRTGKKLIKE